MAPEEPGEGSFERRLLENLPLLRDYVRGMFHPRLRARECSTDLAQSICRELLEKELAVTFSSEAQFRSWLWKVVRNKVRDRIRYLTSRRRDVAREQPIDDEAGEPVVQLCANCATPSQQAVGDELAAAIEAGLDALGEKDRELVVLHRVVGISYRELAERFGMTVDAVSMRVRRAVARVLARVRVDSGFGEQA